MSSPERVRLWQPLSGVRIVRDGPPPPTAEELQARLRESYQQGYADASAHINQQILEQRNEVRQISERLFHSLEDCVTSAVAEVRDALPVLTMQALRRVVAGVEITREAVMSVVDELLGEIGPDMGAIEVRLHPADLSLVTDLEPQLSRIHPGLRFAADESLSRGDCQAVTRFGKVDARLRNKLDKLETSLVPAR